jgi:hypothetical protein
MPPPPSVHAADVTMIVAFSFGNRVGADGSVEPGPVNHRLAVAAARAHAVTGAVVFAQWEIARVLHTQRLVGDDVVRFIEPSRRPDGGAEYLNTATVARAAIEGRSSMDKGAVAVVAHADHAARCVGELARLTVRAGVLVGLALPTDYDNRSGQPWTTNRDRYLAHERSLPAREH